LKHPGHESQSNYSLSHFNNDRLNVQTESEFQDVVHFRNGMNVYGESTDFYSSNTMFHNNLTVTEGTLTIRNMVALNSTDSRVLEIDESRLHVLGDFTVSHNDSNVFSIQDSNVIFGRAGGQTIYNDPVVFRNGATFQSESAVDSGGSVTFERGSDLIIQGNMSIQRDGSNVFYIMDEEGDDNNTIYVETGMVFRHDHIQIMGIEGSNISIEGGGQLEVDTEIILNNKFIITPVDGNSNNDTWWSIFSKNPSSSMVQPTTTGANLYFHSKNGSTIRFDDKFEESILNFTGQHRCSLSQMAVTSSDTDIKIEEYIGRIVCATGVYEDLNNRNSIEINESIPVVELCKRQEDQRVFGVISGIEDSGNEREFKLGNMSFVLNKDVHIKKLMVNSVGEGGIWVCNVKGHFKNGDYITSSDIEGYGMVQNDNIHRNYTVGKITCDCTFDLASQVYHCAQFEYEGLTYRKAFVGCTYSC
jgi:hypothetical protein